MLPHPNLRALLFSHHIVASFFQLSKQQHLFNLHHTTPQANPVELPKEEDEVSDAGSEDIEAESSASEDEDEEEEEGEGEADGEAADEMDTDAPASSNAAAEKPQPPQQQGDVMVH